MRGYPYLGFVGHRGFYGNAELRFPLVNALFTPIGFFGGVRGTMFFNVGGAAYNNESFSPFAFGGETRISRIDGSLIDGIGLGDAVASYGIGVTMNMFGIPFHFDWAKLTDFATTLPGWKFDFWMGYDF